MDIFHFLRCQLHQLHNDEKAASAIEYAIIAGLIAVAIIATVATLGGQLDGVFSSISTTLSENGFTTSG